ncbi:hypothetical protein FIBSPDRAFT_846741 [Athelia psychrophila]|uniref:DUF302 domain-containing protein n=1 Tax=Athelia psychrophila TaxID=1759441 RepID=A0A166XC22_9AGAM|nr:hypothetical protein FIBSPDRAFT_846741 [Fibularhizoctonia sp. CBS 109695]
MVSITDSSISIIRRTIELPVSFESFTQKLESSLGRYDSTALYGTKTEDDMNTVVADTIGSQPFAIFSIQAHSRLLGLIGKPGKATRYIIGDPRLAVQMTSQDVRAALHAPLTILVYEVGGTAKVEYFTAQSVFGQFGNAKIDAVAAGIDKKQDGMVENLVAEILTSAA